MPCLSYHTPNSGLQLIHVFLLLEYLLHGAGQMGPEVGVGTLSVGDPLLERLVGVGPALVETVVLRVQQIVYSGSQPLGPRPRSCNTKWWLLEESVVTDSTLR